jgi:hypothetical protein
MAEPDIALEFELMNQNSYDDDLWWWRTHSASSTRTATQP